MAYVRVVLLVVDDYIFDVLVRQRWINSRRPPHPHILYLLGCPWCIGFWLAVPLGVYLSYFMTLGPAWWVPLALAVNLISAPLITWIVRYKEKE